MRLRDVFPWILAAGPLYAQDPAEAPADNRSNEAHYTISARVDDAPPSELDDGPAKSLTGELTLRWVNRSGDTVSDLWFHLYLNAYANNRSLHLTESLGSLRGTDVERGYGWQDVTSIRVGDRELVDGLTWRWPSPGAPLDRTVFSVDLPEPVPDGGEVEVAIEWESRLPRVRRRTGTKGDFIFLSHWFPKLGVYEGGRGWRTHPFHMNTEFYADYGTYDVSIDLPEEYAGRVGASGVQVGEPTVAEGRVVTRFVAPSEDDRAYADPVAARGSRRTPRVHGFAWTADPDYVVHVRPFRFADWASRHPYEVSETMRALGRTEDEVRLREVQVQVMIQPEREPQWERHYRATCAALFFYGLWYGEYPYEKVTVVDPAWGARAAGGMEYPTLFTCGTRLFTEPATYTPESVTVHEAGHQFWYGLVGNNEAEAAWLDEGLNSYSDSETLYREYGPRRATTSYSRLPEWGRSPIGGPRGSTARALAMESLRVRNPLRWGYDRAGREVPDGVDWLFARSWTWRPLAASPFVDWWRDQPRLTFVDVYTDPRWGDRSGYLRDPNSDPIDRVVPEYVDRRSYRTNSYPRTAVALRSLAAVVGREAFLRGMRAFAEEWRYRHPYPEDFYATFQKGAGVDVQWYFEDVFRGTDTVDWSVSVAQERPDSPKGWFLCEDGTWAEGCAPAGAADPLGLAPPADGDGGEGGGDGEDAGEAPRPRLYDVVLRRDGGLRLPVTVRVSFDDGTTRDFEWSREAQAESRWWRLPLEPGTAAIDAVVIDPERLWYLDRDMSDNQWFRRRDDLAPARWGERALSSAAHTLEWFASVGG